MVWDIVRDSTFGQLVRLATSNKYFSYPEEQANFEFSKYYGDAKHPPNPIDESRTPARNLRPNEALESRVLSEGLYLLNE